MFKSREGGRDRSKDGEEGIQEGGVSNDSSGEFLSIQVEVLMIVGCTPELFMWQQPYIYVINLTEMNVHFK